MEQLIGYTSNHMAIFHLPMPMVMNHGLGFQDSTRLHFKSKSKSDFPYSFLYSATLQDSQPSSLSLINGSSLSSHLSLYYLVSLVISKSLFFILKQTKSSPLHQRFKIFLVSSLHQVAGCCCRRLTAHLTPPSSLHGFSQLPSLRSGKLFFPFHPSFSVFCVCDMDLSFCSNDLFFDM